MIKVLLTTEVEIRLYGKNISHLESLGYNIPRRLNARRYHVPKNAYIKVKTEDLLDQSHILVDVICDECQKEFKNIRWSHYKPYVKNDGKYYCSTCYKKLFGDISFEQWCVENNRQDVIDRWDYGLNKCSPDEISYGTKKKYYFKCSRNLHKSELKNIGNFTGGQKGLMDCKVCNSFAQWGIDNIGQDFLNEYWDYEKNIDDPWAISSKNNNKVWIKCQEKDYHGNYPIRCADFVSGERCPYCSNKSGKVHSLDSLGTLNPQVLDIWSEKNKKSPYEYTFKSHSNAWWKCENKKHKDYYRQIKSSQNCNFRCPECVKERTESFLQEKTRLYLNSLNFTVLHEYNCNIIAQNPKISHYKGRMPYDNELKELKLIIEVHGMQHYRITEFYYRDANKKNTTPEYELHMQQVRDRYKRIYAKSRGYHYLEIPYWTDDKEETWKKLIDDKIKMIINNIE